MDFSHLKKFDIKGNTAEFVLDDIEVEPAPILILKPATQSNRKYFNALLKGSGTRLSRIKRAKIDEKVYEDNLKEDKKLYPEHVIVGWKNVTDTSGKEVSFNKQNCISFVEQLPDWIFEKVRNFAATNENFVEEQMDAEEVSKN